MSNKESLPACPVAVTVGLICNKWKPLVIRDLIPGKARFKDLKNSITGISQKVLTENLREMEKDGLIIRKAYPEIPPRVEYELTDLGKSLEPIIKAMENWGKEYKRTFEES